MDNSNKLFLLNAPTTPPFKFDPALASFTPSMAKRNSAGPFAAGPIVQGASGSQAGGDVLSLSRGTQISGNWYSNFDANQGSISCFFTPEISSGSSVSLTKSYIFYGSANYNIYYNYNGGAYVAKFGNQQLSVTSAVTAGNTYSLVFSWDTKNKIDGTNYLRTSINDAHTFGVTTQPTVSVPDATMYIGCDSSGSYALNGIIEGFHIARMVHFDGTYGTDIGAGDIINLMYV